MVEQDNMAKETEVITIQIDPRNQELLRDVSRVINEMQARFNVICTTLINANNVVKTDNSFEMSPDFSKIFIKQAGG